jgi:hypothetical protein
MPSHPDIPAPLSVSPIPLIPYAISLSLTVAYRGLRDHSSDTDATASALSNRAAMLESLSGRWWTADAMAKLGRKALKSMQNPVGVKRKEVEDLENAMEAEVTVCKYGPFDGRPDESLNQSGAKSVESAGGEDGNANAGAGGTGRGGGLHLLSEAAAQSQTQPKSLSTQTASANSNMPSVSAHSQFSPGSGPTTGSYTHTSPTDSLATPAPNTHEHPQTHTHAHTQIRQNGITILPNVSEPPVPPTNFEAKLDYDANAFDSNDPNLFNDLDNLFDGFFDLSLPTVTFNDFSANWGGEMLGGGMDTSGMGDWGDEIEMSGVGMEGIAGMGMGGQQGQGQWVGELRGAEMENEDHDVGGGEVGSEYPEI